MIIFDCESNGLIRTATRMWVLVAFNPETNEEYVFREGDTGWINLLQNQDLLVGHNITGYDYLLLEKLFNVNLRRRPTFDTLIHSQVLDFNRFNGKHSVEEWAKSLGGEQKVQIEVWDEFSEDIVERCRSDVRLQAKIYKTLRRERDYVEKGYPEITYYLEAEQAGNYFNGKAEWLGWPFKTAEGKRLQEELLEKTSAIEEELSKDLGVQSKPYDMVKGIVDVKYPKYLKNGYYDKHTAKWFDIPQECGIYLEKDEIWDVLAQAEELMEASPSLVEIARACRDYGSRPIDGAYCRFITKELKLSSSADVKTYLFRKGWVPTEYNYVMDNGVPRKTSPKITDDSLELLGEHGKLYRDYMTMSSRLSILNTWLKEVDENDRVHGRCFLIGTPSMRSRHNVIVNIPSVDEPYGAEFRDLFTVPEGWSFIGADSAGNQARGLAHCLGDEEYIDIILNGDVHTYNKEILEKVLLEILGRPQEVQRGQAKRILYAFLFGASGGKLWSYIFGTLNTNKGAQLKKGFIQAVPGFENLVKKLEKAYEASKRNSYQGWIPSLVGNPLYTDSKHKLLVYWLQAIEKITCVSALKQIIDELDDEGIPWQPLIFYHDEVDFAVPDEYAQQAAEIAERAFREAPKKYGIQIMDGEAKVGKTWKECH